MPKNLAGPVIKTDAPKLRYISIIKFCPGKEEDVAKLIDERYAKTGIEDYALSFALHPQGDELMAKVRLHARRHYAPRAAASRLFDYPLRFACVCRPISCENSAHCFLDAPTAWACCSRAWWDTAASGQTPPRR